jgi:hypothetical protein
MNLYTNSNQTTPAGTSVGTYSVAAETTTTALLTITDSRYNTSSTLLSTENDTYRLTTSGTATLIGITLAYPNGITLYMQ